MKTYVFTNRVYPPARGATGELLKELAEGLANAGHKVVVIAGEGRGRGAPRREKINGVEVIRAGTARFTRASHLRRAWSYAGLYPQFAWQIWKLGAVDALISMTDPPLQVAPVTLAGWRARRKIHWAQDIYPELAEKLGVITRGGLLARLLQSISTWALRRQDKVVVLGRRMSQRLVGRGIDAGKVEVIPNWSSVSQVSAEAVAEMRSRLGWDGKFVALYSGNIGLAHDFETLVGAARMLGKSNIAMVFAGEGSRLDNLKSACAGLAHVSFLPPRAKDELEQFLAAPDVHLVTVARGLEGLVVPSKAYGILAAGRPILYVGPRGSEVAELITENNAGIVFANGDAVGLAGVLSELKSDTNRIHRLGENALKLASGFTLGKAVERWQSVLEV